MWVLTLSGWIRRGKRSEVTQLCSHPPPCLLSPSIFLSLLRFLLAAMTSPSIVISSRLYPKRLKSILLRKKGEIYIFFYFSQQSPSSSTHFCSYISVVTPPLSKKRKKKGHYQVIRLTLEREV
jgi:hypothetical protein